MMDLSRTIRIGVSLRDAVSMNTKLSDLTIGDFLDFSNGTPCIIVGAERDLSSMCFVIYVTHGEFPKTQEGAIIPFYTHGYAKRRFPFLFTKTNPILYRRWI